MKICRICNIEKPEELFRVNGKDKNGFRNECRQCEQDKKKTDDYKLRSRYYKIKDRYGLTREEYDQLVIDHPSCAICNEPFGDITPHVDHDHVTGIIRGLLCPNHNKALGLFKDNPVDLIAAANYLIKSLSLDGVTTREKSRTLRVKGKRLAPQNEDEEIV